MRTAVRDWLTRRLAAAAERTGEDLRTEVAKQGWPQPPILAHRRYWPTAPPTPGGGA